MDFKLYGEYPSHTPGLTSYWENCYDHVDGPGSVSDARMTHFTSLARLGLDDFNRQLGYDDNEDECTLKVNKIYQVGRIYNATAAQLLHCDITAKT